MDIDPTCIEKILRGHYEQHYAKKKKLSRQRKYLEKDNIPHLTQGGGESYVSIKEIKLVIKNLRRKKTLNLDDFFSFYQTFKKEIPPIYKKKNISKNRKHNSF